MEGWECKRRGDEEFLDKQAPSLCRKIRSLFRPRKKEGRLPGFQTLTHFHLRPKIADTRGEKNRMKILSYGDFVLFFFYEILERSVEGFGRLCVLFDVQGNVRWMKLELFLIQLEIRRSIRLVEIYRA